jgi:serine/threonine-protein kinase ATR
MVDTLLTHISGIVSRNPAWEADLVDYNIQGAMMVANWGKVEHLAGTSEATSPNLAIARCLLAMRSRDQTAVNRHLESAYISLGSSITMTGPLGYRRAYSSVLSLHLLHEFQLIFEQLMRRDGRSIGIPTSLSRKLQERLSSISPSFSSRELVLSTRRVAFSIMQ